jgi:hypothetical protein
MGVQVPDFVKIGSSPALDAFIPEGADASYAQMGRFKADDIVTWEMLTHPATGQVPIRLRSNLLQSDIGFVSTLIHELTEVSGLHTWFEEQGGEVTAGELRSQIDRLHNDALEAEARFRKTWGSQ